MHSGSPHLLSHQSRTIQIKPEADPSGPGILHTLESASESGSNQVYDKTDDPIPHIASPPVNWIEASPNAAYPHFQKSLCSPSQGAAEFFSERADSPSETVCFWYQQAGKVPSTSSMVQYFGHHDEYHEYEWLNLPPTMYLDQAVIAIQQTSAILQQPPVFSGGADMIMQAFKEEYNKAMQAGFWGFYRQDRDIGGPYQTAIYLRNVWMLTRWCGHLVRLVGHRNLVRLEGLQGDAASNTIRFYTEDNGVRRAWVSGTLQQIIDPACNEDPCNCGIGRIVLC